MVSEYTKRKSFDNNLRPNKSKKGPSFMKTIISQKLINVLKSKIFNVISLNLFNNVEFLLNNLLCNENLLIENLVTTLINLMFLEPLLLLLVK